MEKSNITTAPSSRRPFDGTGVRRISGRPFKIGTWNVRSLNSPEKIYNVCKEMDRLHIDILGLSDVRWKHQGVHRVDEILLVLKKIRKRRINVVNIRKISDKNCRSEVVREINEWAAEAKQSHENAEQQWYKLKTKVHKINANILKPDKWVAKEPWMTEKIYQLMEKRRLHKNDDKLYKTIDREIRREVRYARNSWYRKKWIIKFITDC
ncbi:unnamed protein product, partial [Brenthis ino]